VSKLDVDIGSRAFTRRKILVPFAAIGFGLSIGRLLASTTNSTVAIVYGTRYGSTAETASWIRVGLGIEAHLINIEETDVLSRLLEAEFLIVGSGIWSDRVHPKLLQLLQSTQASQLGQVVASFVVCGTRPTNESRRSRIRGYLAQLDTAIEYEPEFSRSFGGRLVVDQLTKRDRKSLAGFYRRVFNTELISWDRTEEQAAKEFGRKVFNNW
jgi:menaquinone-dependent protoporphyrinogen IX oxidase